MPVTIITAKHCAQEFQPSKLNRKAQPSHTPEELLRASVRQEDYEKFQAMIQSSFSEIGRKTVYPVDNGFLRAAITAYNHHHHLILRPEDIWFSILTQFSLYVNAHAESLRSTFVSHSGKKKLFLVAGGTIHSFDWSVFATQMTKLLVKSVKDPNLRSWMLPSFSTTTPTDTVTASILMMGTLQKYFEFGMILACGIPSVTLLGTKADWQDILSRLPKLASFGSEPAQFAELLTPVLKGFISSFDSPTSGSTLSFWSRICHVTSMGSGDPDLSGWLTAFCFWDSEGKSLYDCWWSYRLKGYEGQAGCELDGVEFHGVGMTKIPSGSGSVPVVVDDNGKMYDTMMVAGSIGVQVSASGGDVETPPPYGCGGGTFQGKMVVGGMDTLQPISGWWMFDTGSKGVKRGNFEGVMDFKEGEMPVHIADPSLDIDERTRRKTKYMRGIRDRLKKIRFC